MGFFKTRPLLLALVMCILTATAVWAVTIVPVQSGWTDRSGSLTTGGTAQTIAAANAGRSYFIFQNISAGDFWINCGVTAVQDQPSFKIVANGSFDMEASFVCTGAISVIGATTGQKWTAKES